MNSSRGYKLNSKTSSMLEVLGINPLELNVTHVDTPLMVETIMAFLQNIEIDKEEIIQISEEDLPYPETLRNIIILINLETTFSEIIKYIYITDFTLNDIIHPERKRSSKVLRYMSNFLLYIANKNCKLAESLHEVNEKRRKLQELKDEAKIYNENSAKLVLQTGKLLFEIEKNTKEIDEQKLLLHNKNVAIKEQQLEMNNIQKEYEKNGDILTKHQTELSQKLNYRASLENNLVTSPSRIDQELSILCKLKEIKENEIFSTEQNSPEQIKTLKVIQNVTKSMEHLIQRCHEYSQTEQKYIATMENVENLDKLLHEIKSLIGSEHHDREDDSQQKQYCVKNLEQVKVQCEKEIEELLKQHSNLERDLLDADNNLKLKLTEKDKIANDIKFFNDHISKLKEENHRFIQQCKEMYTKEKTAIMDLNV